MHAYQFVFVIDVLQGEFVLQIKQLSDLNTKGFKAESYQA